MKKLIPRMIGAWLNAIAVVSPKTAARKGFLLFCRPLRGPLTSKHHEFFNSAEKFTLSHDDVSVQGYKWGRGERKILFLHGWQSHAYRWKPFIEALSPNDYSIYALDAPGHGLSAGSFLTVPLYSDLIRNFVLSLEDIDTVVAHSLGGFSLLYAFYQHPLIPVRKAVLMAPPGEASEFISVFKSTLGLSEKTVDLVLREFQDRYDVTPDFFSATKFAHSLNINGLIIHDEQDAEAPYHHSKAISQAWKRSSLLTTKGMGHNLRHPSIVDVVTGFIADEAVTQQTVASPNGLTALR